MEVAPVSWCIFLHAKRSFHPLFYTNLICFVGLAFIATILGQTIFNWLLKWMSATVISMSILGETIGTCILAYFILNETISLQQGLGITVILLV